VAQLGQDSVTQVWTYFDRTGKNELKTVNHVFKNQDPELTYLTLESKKGSSELITTTPEHPFYVSSSKIVGPQQGNLGKNWVGAGSLEIGDKIRTADGSSGIVLSVVNVVQARVMYNLEVQGNHDFFVGDNGWLVHNCFNLAAATNVKTKGREWVSPEGLIYGVDRHFPNKVLHVLDHLKPVSARTAKTAGQTTFSVPRDELLPLLDEVWRNRGSAVVGDAFKFEVNVGRVIGTNGERTVRLVADPLTGMVVTAYPIK
jgi:hypothetical protein